MKGFSFENTKWRVIDSHWVNIDRTCELEPGKVSHSLYNGTLADYLWFIGFSDLPEYIEYCLAARGDHKMKFRRSGGIIDIYLTPNK